jgi:hypothetical protein
MILDDYIILGRTIPFKKGSSIYKNGGVCTAGYSPSMESFIRVSPFSEGKCPKLDQPIRVRVARCADPRYETWRPSGGWRLGDDTLWDGPEALQQYDGLNAVYESGDSVAIIRADAPPLLNEVRRGDDGNDIPRLKFWNVDGAHDLGLRDWDSNKVLMREGLPALLRVLKLETNPLLLCGTFANHTNRWCVIRVLPETGEEKK